MSKPNESLDEVFAALKRLLEKHSRGLEARDSLPGSQAKSVQAGYYLYGRKEVSILGRKPEQAFVAGVMHHAKSVGFYSMALYTHPADFSLSASLERCRSGKSCLKIPTAAPEMLKELEALLKATIAFYKSAGWI